MPVNSFENYPMSWKPTLDKNDRPLYIQLARRLRDDIASGALLPGTRLPPQRELADFLDINLSTVSRAFGLCSEKGLLTGTVGDGTYVSYSSITNLNASQRDGFIRLDSMTPETVPQDELAALLRRMLGEHDFPQLLQYSAAPSGWQLEAAARLMARASCSCKADDILIAGGGQNAIAAIFAGLLDSGDKIGVDPLTYPGVKSAARLFGIQLVPIAQTDGEMSEEGIRYAVKNEGISALYIMPDYQNPTSYIMSTYCRKMIANLSREYGLLIIEDGILNLLSEGVHSVHNYAPEQTVFTLSISKTVSPALKTAYIAAPEKYYRKLDEALYSINLSQSALLTELGSRLIASEQLDKLLARRAEGIERRNALADRILDGFELKGGSRSLSRWLILPAGVKSSDFELEAARRGVAVYGSEHFAVGKSLQAEGVRLAVCAPEDLEELEKALLILRGILA